MMNSAYKEIYFRGKKIRVNSASRSLFWSSFEKNEWEPDTFIIFEKFITSTTLFFDIGAWIGPTTLFGAQIASQTYAFEPDPVAFKELKDNLAKNGDEDWAKRTNIYNKAVTSRGQAVVIGNIQEAGNSSSSTLFSDETICWEVEGFKLSEIITEKEAKNSDIFIKIDIEGGEYDLLPSTKKIFQSCTNIVLFLSLHPSFIMSKILKGKTGVLFKIWRRVLLLYKHYLLVRSLPFKYYYNSKGIAVNLYIHLLKIAVSGKFINEILATNNKWSS